MNVRKVVSRVVEMKDSSKSKKQKSEATSVEVGLASEGYMDAAEWTDDESWGEEEKERYEDNGSQFSDEAIKDAEEDVKEFLKKAEPFLTNYEGTYSQVGHDFWLTRNRHGAGFWDRPKFYGGQENADKLTEIAQEFGEVDSYIGDDGYFYFG
jgi:hypothetical protein